MTLSYTTLALDVGADPTRVFEILSSTEGQRAFLDRRLRCLREPRAVRVRAGTGRPGGRPNRRSGQARPDARHLRLPVLGRLDLGVELGEATRAESGTSVLFRHHAFAEGYGENDLGHTAQTWAMVLDRLAKHVATGTPQPFFLAASRPNSSYTAEPRPHNAAIVAVDVRPVVLVHRQRGEFAEFMFDPANDLRWTGGITSSRPAQPGRLVMGTRVERSAKFLGRTFDYGYVVTKHEPDWPVELKVDRPFPMVIRYELQDAPEGTLLPSTQLARRDGSSDGPPR